MSRNVSNGGIEENTLPIPLTTGKPTIGLRSVDLLLRRSAEGVFRIFRLHGSQSQQSLFSGLSPIHPFLAAFTIKEASGGPTAGSRHSHGTSLRCIHKGLRVRTFTIKKKWEKEGKASRKS